MKSSKVHITLGDFCQIGQLFDLHSSVSHEKRPLVKERLFKSEESI